MTTSQMEDISNVEIDAFKRFDGLVKSGQSQRLDKEAFRDLIEGSSSSAAEKAAMLKILERVKFADDGHLSLKQWNAFVFMYEDEIMRRGHINNCWHQTLNVVDLFKVGAWHNFEYYEQVTFFGAAVAVLMALVFLITIATSTAAFNNDVNTIIQQTFLPNEYGAMNVGSFFFFFRTAQWQNIVDPSLYSFKMAYYVKRLNGTSGAIIEEWIDVPSRVVTKQDMSWWPDSVSTDAKAVSPNETIISEGAYHLDFFKQLEVKLVPCQNSSSAGAVICKSPEEIKAALHGGSVNFVVMSTENGYVSARTRYWTTLTDQTKQIDLWFDRKQVKVTAKFPTSSDKVSVFMPFESATQQISPLWSDATVAVWWFSQAESAMSEVRKRESATDLLAKWGGTWASLFSLCGVAAHFYNKRRLDSQIGTLRQRSRLVEDLRIVSSVSHRNLETSASV